MGRAAEAVVHPHVAETRAAYGKAETIFRFAATRDQLFKTFPALADLTDRADGGKVSIQVEAASEAGFERSWLRNAVEEPLDEADVERSQGRED